MPPKTKKANKSASKASTKTTAPDPKRPETPTPTQPITATSHCAKGTKRPASYEGTRAGPKRPKSFFSPYNNVYEKVIGAVLDDARLAGRINIGSTVVQVARSISDALDAHFFLEFSRRHADVVQRTERAEQMNSTLKEKVDELVELVELLTEENEGQRRRLGALRNKDSSDSDSDDSESTSSSSDSEESEESE